MYLEFYGLKEMPFGHMPDSRYIFKTESHFETLKMLAYGVEHSRGLMLITGEAGTGKTTMLRLAIDQFGERVLPLYIFNPILTVAEFFEQLIYGFGLGLPLSASKPEVLAALGYLLSIRHKKNLRTALIIDEAQSLSLALLEEIRLLLNFRAGGEKLLQVVLSAQPEFQERIKQADLSHLRQRIAMRSVIHPLNVFEVNKYVRFRLKLAGATNVGIFNLDAVSLIAGASGGIPRLINNICDNALLTGYGAGKEVIGREEIEEVLESLDLGQSKSSENIHMPLSMKSSAGFHTH